jgi:hypothetical protein
MSQHALAFADLALQRSFESGALPPSELDHRAHVALAYSYLAEGDVESATARMRQGLVAYLAAHAIPPEKYHETLTRAWILAVHHFMRRSPIASSADDFIARSPVLLESSVMRTHYSALALFSPEARERFVEPDLEPIPR